MDAGVFAVFATTFARVLDRVVDCKRTISIEKEEPLWITFRLFELLPVRCLLSCCLCSFSVGEQESNNRHHLGLAGDLEVRRAGRSENFTVRAFIADLGEYRWAGSIEGRPRMLLQDRIREPAWSCRRALGPRSVSTPRKRGFA